MTATITLTPEEEQALLRRFPPASTCIAPESHLIQELADRIRRRDGQLDVGDMCSLEGSAAVWGHGLKILDIHDDRNGIRVAVCQTQTGAQHQLPLHLLGAI